MMREQTDEHEALISGYLDGELDAAEKAKVERLLEEDDAFRREFQYMKQLVTATSQLGIESPPEEVWDTFLDGVYNRVERQTGWVLLISGVAILALIALYWFVAADWGSPLLKMVLGGAAAGLFILFVSVLRQRLRVARTDRYNKEVKW